VTHQELLGQLLQQGLQEHQSGQFERAERNYRTILGKNPKHADALNLLGMLLAQTGRDEEGAEMMRRAIALAPNFAPLHANLGETYRRQKKYDQALSSLKRAIALDPRMPDAQNNLSATFADMGHWDESLAAAQKALAARPGFASAEFNLGNALAGLGRHEEAIGAFRRALAIQPAFADALINLGTALQKALRIDEAIAVFVEATRVNPDSEQAFNNLAVLLEARGRADEAMAAYGMALRINPRNTKARSNYGFALAKKGQLDEGMEFCKSAAASADADADTFVHLGFVYHEKGDLAESLKWNKRAIALDPKSAAAHNAIGVIHKDMGEIKAAIASFQRAVEFKPEEVGFYSNLVYTLNFDAACSPQELFAQHRAWAKQHCDRYRVLRRPHGNDRDPERRIRIGYVSPDFRLHPVGRFMLPLLAQHDHSKFEVFCYASVKQPDSATQRMRGYADVWRDVRGISNIETTEIVRRDQIDILVDLTMHMAEHRLTLFAYKPAPVQVTYLAYVGTTGMDTIDYRVTDPWLDPPLSSDEFYSEKSVRPGQSYWCYEAPLEDLPLSPAPLLRNGFVTFGCLNNFCKVTDEVLEIWCRVLTGVEGSRLMIHAHLGAHRERVRKAAAQWGVDPNRIIFVGTLPLDEYMAKYGEIDIGLDPFPYVGGTTTCDAMWMGVPVVTLSGQTAISRGGLSIMNNVGLPELIARSADEYVRIALELAREGAHLQKLRETLRERMKASPLMDAKRFTRDMEGAFRQMWRKWCAEGGEGESLTEAMGHLEANRPQRAEAILRRLLAQTPEDAEVMRLLGVALCMTDKIDEGIALLRKAVELKPQEAVLHVNLGWALQRSGWHDEAIAEHREGVRLRPDSADAQYNLGFALASQRRLDEAIAPLREAIRLQPRHVQAALDLCNVLRELGRVEEALPIARETARMAPQSAEAQNNLGVVLGELLQVEESAESLREAVRLKPDWAIARFNLARTLVGTGELDEAIASYRRVIELKPDMMEAYTGLAFAAHYHPDYDSKKILEECRQWSRTFELPLKGKILAHLNDRTPDRRLRIGYVSPDFREHPAGRYVLPLLEGHDHGRFEIFAYSNGNRSDSLTERLRNACDHWREIRKLSDDEVARLIRRDGIDVLIDLSMHMTDNRIMVFARKPAPVQATWLAYPGTTGLEAMDYRVTDPYLDPPGSDEFFSEKTIRLRDAYWCFQPMVQEIDPGRAPMTTNGHVTFGNLNNFSKISKPTLQLWAQVLEHVEGSRLLMLAPEGRHRDRIRQLFAERKIDPGRLEFVGFQSPQKYLETYKRIDIGLDTLPYNGHTTSFDSIWMGVPVITRIGKTVVGRAGLSLLSNMGMQDLASETDEGFVRIAEDLARNPTRVQELRKTLRGQMQVSPLMDGKRFARSMEEVYDRMWREWCKRGDQSAQEFNRLGESLRANQPYEGTIGDADGGLAHLDAATAAFRRAIELEPDFAEAHCNLGQARKDVAQLEEAIACFRKAIELNPDFSDGYDCLAYWAHFHPDYDQARILAENSRWADRFEKGQASPSRAETKDRPAKRRMRAGYVGNGFSQHCQSLFTLPLLSNHNREQFEIFCYADVPRPDRVTERIRRCVEQWRLTWGMSDEALAKQIAEDGIDILVDLTMHMPGSRLRMFAQRPAPVQATWLAYPGTTGLRSIDYRLSDPYLEPPGAEGFYSEKTAQLPETFWCYDPVADELDVGSPPMVANSFVTFGSLNNFCKVSQQCLELWAHVLSQVAGSRMLLLSPRGMHREAVREFFAGRKIDPGRIEFVDFQPRRKYLETYRRIDIGLDTVPVNGHTTSLDSLWMGVPVVTKLGTMPMGRAGWSQLNNLGLSELCGEDDGGFVRIAAELARDPRRLTELRLGLRERMKASPLMDGKRFACAIEAAFRRMLV
jgi:predicted O-linked N-acetylglucosamine transferase (SPINDLY family)